MLKAPCVAAALAALFMTLALFGCGESTTTTEASKATDAEASVVADPKGEERSGVGKTPTVDE
jgi:hypothetical protein